MAARGASDPIPSQRARLEHRIIEAIEAGPEEIVRVLHGFEWLEHPELACLGLAEIASTQSSQGAAALALMAFPYCEAACGPYCLSCPLEGARQH